MAAHLHDPFPPDKRTFSVKGSLLDPINCNHTPPHTRTQRNLIKSFFAAAPKPRGAQDDTERRRQELTGMAGMAAVVQRSD